MKIKKNKLLLIIYLLNICLPNNQLESQELNNLIQPDLSKNQNNNKELIQFSFKDKKLIDIINMITEKKGINYIIPQRASEQEDFKKQTVTYQPININKKEISIDKAWELVTLFLELSGFSWFKRKGIWEIVPIGTKETAGITREPLPLYVSVKPVDLPDTEERIRYVYYLSNLKASDEKDNPINQIIKDMSSEGAPEPIVLPKFNGFILVDKANVISSVINIISQLDATGFRETIEVIPLYNTSAQSVATVFETLKKAAGEEKTSPFIRTETKASISFFASDTQVIPDTRNNTIILMGRQSAVDRISDFIHNHVDIVPESGRSIMHYYNLQYLNAEEFAPVLQEIVKSEVKGAQATQAAAGGPERFFQGVIVEAEKVQDVKPIQGPLETETVKSDVDVKFDAKGITGVIQTGGNRLIIAAVHEDWLIVRDFIQKLDRPQPQVILEVLIADFTHNRNKIIAGDIRTKGPIPDNEINFLASHITPVGSVLGANPATLASDLLQVLSGGASGTGGSVPTVASLIAPGSFLISFNDPQTPALGVSRTASGDPIPGGIWALIQVLDRYLDARVMSHPFLVSTNNLKSTITQSLVKRQRGDAIPSQSGTITIQIDNIPASIQVQMIPRLVSENRLGLQLAVDVNDFQSPTSLDRVTRRVETSANINSGDIWVIGGLTRLVNRDGITSTPILARIPIIGRFFQGITKTLETSNLAIFISPTIVMPKFREGLDLYTKDKIRKSRRNIGDNIIYGNVRDPITYLFLPNSRRANDDLIQEYLNQTENAPLFEEIKTNKEIRADRLRRTKKIKSKLTDRRQHKKQPLKSKTALAVPA